jgi:hypothetical protein
LRSWRAAGHRLGGQFGRAVEQPSGELLCWFGVEGLAVTPEEESAVAHLSGAAITRTGADLVALYLHRVDGSVELLPVGWRGVMPAAALMPAM